MSCGGTGTAHTDIENNLVRGDIRLDGGEAELRQNLTGRLEGYFVHPASGNLALTSAAVGAIDRGVSLPEVTDDIRGRPRRGHAGIGGPRIFPNRMRLREGPGAIDCEHIGGLTGGVHSSLLQSAPEKEGGEPVIEVFPAWPRDWDAHYTLLARGAFLVSASRTKERIEFVEIQSQVGGECRLRNPWPDTAITLYRSGKKADFGELSRAEDLEGALLRFPTERGETITAVPRGSTPPRKKVP